MYFVFFVIYCTKRGGKIHTQKNKTKTYGRDSTWLLKLGSI